jgi:putative endonuclease
MYYTYILISTLSGILYFDFCEYLKKRLKDHNSGHTQFTKGHLSWELVRYCAFPDKQKAKDFELYLKSGFGKAFTYKRLVNIDSAKNEGLP